jgi:hypothetical protein
MLTILHPLFYRFNSLYKLTGKLYIRKIKLMANNNNKQHTRLYYKKYYRGGSDAPCTASFSHPPTTLIIVRRNGTLLGSLRYWAMEEMWNQLCDRSTIVDSLISVFLCTPCVRKTIYVIVRLSVSGFCGWCVCWFLL